VKNLDILRTQLDELVVKYNRPNFITNDPISIPHSYSKKQDIEITAFFAATLAWGNRTTIINKCNELFERMDNSPFDFIKNHQIDDRKSLLGFKHRTFNDTDLLFIVDFLQQHFQKEVSLETAFFPTSEMNVKEGLIHFKDYAFEKEYAPNRSKKHISSPVTKSACKRLNMFLRWMVRKDNKGVDFGIWNNIQPSELICPLDVHVERNAKKFNLLSRKQTDWKAAEELTVNLKKLAPDDPVKYDFALFGLGVDEKGTF